MKLIIAFPLLLLWIIIACARGKFFPFFNKDRKSPLLHTFHHVSILWAQTIKSFGFKMIDSFNANNKQLVEDVGIILRGSHNSIQFILRVKIHMLLNNISSIFRACHENEPLLFCSPIKVRRGEKEMMSYIHFSPFFMCVTIRRKLCKSRQLDISHL